MASPYIYMDTAHIKQNNECAVYLRIYLNGKNVSLPLDVYDRPDNFDKSANAFVGKDSKDKNLLIKRALGTASDIVLKYQVHKRLLTKDLFIKEFQNPSSFTDFIVFMQEQIKSRRGEISDNTIEAHLSVWRKLKEYKESILLAEIDEDFLKQYNNYMVRTLKNAYGTVHNNMKTIKTYILKAFRMGLIQNNPFTFVKLKAPKSFPEFLTLEERELLLEKYNKCELNENLQRVTRWFLFSCFTGLRISDLRSITHENIQFGILSFKPIKTMSVNNNKVYIPLGQTALKLIKDEGGKKRGLLFKCDSEKTMNENIKVVMDIVGINKKVSFHTARHTFATSFLEKAKSAKALLILQRLLGHAKLDHTLIYAHLVDEDIKNAMAEFD